MTRFSALGSSVLGVATANIIAYVLQMTVPILLVRVFSAEDFATYRIVWLVEATVMAFAMLGVPQGLSYFLPRHVELDVRRQYIQAALIIVATAAATVAFLLSPLSPIVSHIPNKGQPISAWFFSVFLFIWILGALIEWLPVSDGQSTWQARLIFLLAIGRTTTIGFAALHFGTIGSVLTALILFAIIRVVILLLYISAFYGIAGRPQAPRVSEFARYAFPMGLAGGLYIMRQHAELWVVGAIASATQFAAFSIAIMPSALLSIVRATVNNVALPHLSKIKATSNLLGVASGNQKATTLTAFILLPIIVFLFLCADMIVEVLFTSKYGDAASVMRVYLIGAVFLVFDGNMILKVFACGKFLLSANVVSLVVVIPASAFGYSILGLPGAAIGSSLVLVCNQLVIALVASRLLSASIFEIYEIPKIVFYFGAASVAAVPAWGVTELGGASPSFLLLATSCAGYAVIYLLICRRGAGLPFRGTGTSDDE